MRGIFIFFCAAICLSASSVNANEKEKLRLAEKYYHKGEYYQAITEIERLASYDSTRFPGPAGYLLKGKTFFMGGNYTEAVSAYYGCVERFPFSPEAEEAMYMAGRARMTYGSTLYAARDLTGYLKKYPGGRFAEDAKRDLCYTSALGYDLKSSRMEIQKYAEQHPGGRHAADLAEVDRMIIEEINRPRKSQGLSLGMSFLIPGFGHFYTGKIKEGLLSFFSNALFIYLTADAINDGDKFRAFFFGFVEMTFYQHSLTSAINNVYEYNSDEKFISRIKLRISARF